jgi:hypothetical protein
MKEIWKYSIPDKDFFEVTMPVGSKVLTVQVQRDTACIWVLVNPIKPKETRRFRLAGTGHDIKPQDTKKYIGTFQQHVGTFAYHLFELDRESK